MSFMTDINIQKTQYIVPGYREKPIGSLDSPGGWGKHWAIDDVSQTDRTE